MGYTTDFTGAFDLDKPLTEAHRNFLLAFNQTRRMKRDPQEAEKLDDPIREAAGLPVGPQGGYFVGAAHVEEGKVESPNCGQDNDASVLDHNEEPEGQPGLWCQWTVNEEGTQIVWDYGEKFYYYTKWLAYLVEHFLKPWGYVLNGEVRWSGEVAGDLGTVIAEDNKVSGVPATINY